MNFKVDLSGQVALITGAGRGIGRAIAIALADAGALVCVNDINPDTARATAEEILASGGQAFDYVADVSLKMQIGSMIEAARDRWGRLDILINNAGVEPKASVLALDEWDWERTINVNLKGTFLCTQLAGRVMRDQGSGIIVNIASIAGHKSPLPNASAYCASKAGVVGFTRECAREFAAFGIRVNAVCPGVIITPMTQKSRDDPDIMRKWMEDIPQNRLGETAEVAAAVLFLCSGAASYVNGHALIVDGGKVMG
ncbi:MAG: SDR family oxidoreductase [Anaerolineales bacterium]|nr:MAG: SDR family oxidoreductase [Anaerolineales bacterium]